MAKVGFLLVLASKAGASVVILAKIGFLGRSVKQDTGLAVTDDRVGQHDVATLMFFDELCASEGRLIAEHIVTVQQLCIRWQCTTYSQRVWQKLNASLCVNEQRGIPCRPMVTVTVCRHIDDYNVL